MYWNLEINKKKLSKLINGENVILDTMFIPDSNEEEIQVIPILTLKDYTTEDKKTPWEMLRSYDTIDDGEGMDFVNWVFVNICKPNCGVTCNDHYIDGPEFKNMIGCFLLKYSEDEAKKILDWLLKNPNLEYKKCSIICNNSIIG